MSLNVVTGVDFVQICGTYKGEEIEVHWDQAEWVEDPSLVITIAGAIGLACHHPDEFVARLKGKRAEYSMAPSIRLVVPINSKED